MSRPNQPKVVLWRSMYDPAGIDILRERGADVTLIDTSDAAEVIAALPGASALWFRYPERVDRKILEAAKDLVVVSTSGFGTDNVDIASATALGILVVNQPGFGRIPVSEHTLTLMLATAKRLVWADRATREGTAWDQRSGLTITELDGKTVGIVGLGYVGSELARKLVLAFRCRVLGYDPYVDPRIAHLTDVEMVGSLDALLRESAYLCLCPVLTPETEKMIGRRELALLPKGAIVVNTSRGRVLDLDALADAMKSGHVQAAGLDVYSPEPLPADHPLVGNPDVLLTPHTGGLSVETTSRMTVSAIDQIFAAIAGDLPHSPVNRDVWSQPQSRRPGR
jgi:phosphoglycerate dehydrogenase-like enzyme